MKTHITYFVSDNCGNNYNGELYLRPKATRNAVISAALKHAAKRGFVGHQLHVTATGCAAPMLAHTILA